MKWLKEERGFSLLEVIAALVILTIITLSFYYIFIQSTKVNSNNNKHYTASAVARELSAQITASCSAVKLDESVSDLCKYDSTLMKTASLNEFPYQLIIQDITSPIVETEYYRLRKVTIKVWDKKDDMTKDHPKSITYTSQREVIK